MLCLLLHAVAPLHLLSSSFHLAVKAGLETYPAYMSCIPNAFDAKSPIRRNAERISRELVGNVLPVLFPSSKSIFMKSEKMCFRLLLNMFSLKSDSER